MTALRVLAGGADVPVDADLADFEHWQSNLRGLAPNTVRVRRDMLGRLALYLGKPLREATEGDLLRWEHGQVAGRAPETRRSYVSHTRAFYRWAVLAGIIGADPSARLTNPKLLRALPRPMPEEGLRQAVELARPKMRLLILLAAFCGLRCQEISGLHWTDLTRTEDGQTTLLVREGKGGKERVVPVPAVVIESLLAYEPRRSGPIFYGCEAKPMDARSVSSSINRFLRRNGLNYTAHQLRHRYGTTAYRLSKDIRMVQELLGHSSPTTTARYAAYDKSNEAEMVKAMDRAWRGETGRDIAEPSEDELEAIGEALAPEPEAPRQGGVEALGAVAGRWAPVPSNVDLWG